MKTFQNHELCVGFKNTPSTEIHTGSHVFVQRHNLMIASGCSIDNQSIAGSTNNLKIVADPRLIRFSDFYANHFYFV